MTITERWQRYEQALLAVLGFAQFPPPAALVTYQLLLMPTFHQVAAVEVTQEADTTFITMALLQDVHLAAKLFARIWRSREECMPLAQQQAERLEDLFILSEAQAQGLQELLAAIPVAQLQDVSSSARDGITIFVQWYARDVQHAFRLSNPDQHEAIQHSALIRWPLEVIAASSRNETICRYIQAVLSYF
jgi:hypothetical protein